MGAEKKSYLAALMRRFLRWWRHEPSSKEETVEVSGLPQQPPREPVGQVFTHEGHPEIAVVDLGRDISDALRVSWDAGHPFESGGVIQSVWLQPLFATATTAASSLLAGNVFLGDGRSLHADNHRRWKGVGRHRVGRQDHQSCTVRIRQQRPLAGSGAIDALHHCLFAHHRRPPRPDTERSPHALLKS